jgi:hypothetical protein
MRGELMLRAHGWLLAMLVLVAGGSWLYNHTGSPAVSTSGDVFPGDNSTDSQDAKDDGGSTTSAKPEPTPTAPVQPTVANSTLPAPGVTPTPPPASAAKPTVGLLIADSIPRDPPTGMAFGGSGKYQWYRQGDITWRIDTISGAACIDFATMEQWGRPVVYSHGCNRS